MQLVRSLLRRRSLTVAVALAALAGPVAVLAGSGAATADGDGGWGHEGGHGHEGFRPGDLLVTTGVWTTDANITAGTTQLPPNCATANPTYVTCGTAVAPGTYPIVFNNDASDGSFGVTEPIVLDELDPHSGRLVRRSPFPTIPAGGDYLTTSFSSKSELALNQSTDGQYDTFIGYVAAPGTIDASNANTPGEIDPTIADSATSRLPGGGRGEPRASSRSPRPTPSAATTAGPPCSTPRTATGHRSSRPATPATAPTPSPPP